MPDVNGMNPDLNSVENTQSSTKKAPNNGTPQTANSSDKNSVFEVFANQDSNKNTFISKDEEVKLKNYSYSKDISNEITTKTQDIITANPNFDVPDTITSKIKNKVMGELKNLSAQVLNTFKAINVGKVLVQTESEQTSRTAALTNEMSVAIDNQVANFDSSVGASLSSILEKAAVDARKELESADYGDGKKVEKKTPEQPDKSITGDMATKIKNNGIQNKRSVNGKEETVYKYEGKYYVENDGSLKEVDLATTNGKNTFVTQEQSENVGDFEKMKVSVNGKEGKYTVGTSKDGSGRAVVMQDGKAEYVVANKNGEFTTVNSTISDAVTKAGGSIQYGDDGKVNIKIGNKTIAYDGAKGNDNQYLGQIEAAGFQNNSEGIVAAKDLAPKEPPKTAEAPASPSEDAPIEKKEDSQKQKTYTVVSGDSLSKIAKANGMTVAQLVELNPTLKGREDMIHPGDQIKLEDGGTSSISKPKTVATKPKTVEAASTETETPEGKVKPTKVKNTMVYGSGENTSSIRKDDSNWFSGMGDTDALFNIDNEDYKLVYTSNTGETTDFDYGEVTEGKYNFANDDGSFNPAFVNNHGGGRTAEYNDFLSLKGPNGKHYIVTNKEINGEIKPCVLINKKPIPLETVMKDGIKKYLPQEAS